MEESGIAQIIDTRRFSIPVSQSIRQLVSFVTFILSKSSKDCQSKNICNF